MPGHEAQARHLRSLQNRPRQDAEGLGGAGPQARLGARPGGREHERGVAGRQRLPLRSRQIDLQGLDNILPRRHGGDRGAGLRRGDGEGRQAQAVPAPDGRSGLQKAHREDSAGERAQGLPGGDQGGPEGLRVEPGPRARAAWRRKGSDSALPAKR